MNYNQKKFPKVSILINNYNYASFLADAIDSALNQSYTNIEVIVVDDGSTDESPAIISSYGNNIIPVLKENGGQASAFNAGFAASRGEIICFLDADDYFLPNKVEAIVELFTCYPLAEWIFHELQYVDKFGKILDIIHQSNLTETKMLDLRVTLMKGKKLPYTVPCGLCFKRTLLEKILPMPTAKTITISDNFLKCAALALSPGLHCTEKLACQRIHDRNAYTFRQDIEPLRAEIGIKTAFYLRQKLPDIAPFTNKLFTNFFGKLLGLRGIKQALELDEARWYLEANFSPRSWLRYGHRILFFLLKSMWDKKIKP